MTDDLCFMSSVRLRTAFARRDCSPVEVARALLDRIERLDPAYNAFSFLDRDDTLRMAKASEARWLRGAPLGAADGMPVTVKDNMAVTGWPRRSGSLTVPADERSSVDSACVARLREAGAVFLGKTTASEFSWKGVTDSPLNGVSRNPWNPALTPGGSSGGAAIAALLGLGVWHTASDAAGSIRIPASFCAVQGFKPTFGIVPNYPASAFSSLGHHGAIAKSFDDVADMLAVISGPDRRDATAAPPGLIDFLGDFPSRAADGLRGRRVGYFRGTGETDPEILALLDQAVLQFEALGAAVEPVEVDFADARAQIECYWRVGCALVMEAIPADRRGLVDPALAEKGRLGHAVSGIELRSVQISRENFASELHRLHERFDFLVMPAVPVQPFAAGSNVPSPRYGDWLDWAGFAYPFNLTQQPVAVAACGLTASGLPAALQIIGPRYADRAVLDAARAFEAVSPPPRFAA